MTTDIDISLLGPTEIRVDGVPVTPAAVRSRRVAALLAVELGRVVTPDALVDELWGDRPPGRPVLSVQTYVLRLRKHIGAVLPPGSDPKAVLRTVPGGYSLDPARVRVDTVVYDEHAATGMAALHAGNLRTAAAHLRAALARWRGPALADLRTGPGLTPHLRRLTASRAALLDARVEADLGLGRHQALLPEMAAMTEREPLSERLWGHYMVALTRSGHPARAADAYRVLCRSLDERLGVGPSPALRALGATLGARR